jgi:uncharacterized membrane protein
MGVIDIMNIVKIKGYVCVIISIVALSGMMFFVYNTGITTIMGIIKREDYIYYDPKQITLLFCFLYGCYGIIHRAASETIQRKNRCYQEKMFIPTMVYTIAAFVIGIPLSMVISFIRLVQTIINANQPVSFHPAVIMPELKKCVSRGHIYQQLKGNCLPVHQKGIGWKPQAR